MKRPVELTADQLWRQCDGQQLGFRTTEELEPLDGILGQPRVEAAIEFGTEIGREGFNIFAFGPPGIGKHTTVRRILEASAAKRPIPPDFCYVNNFEEPHRPRLLTLPPGKARELRADVDRLVEELGTVLRSAFEGEEYQARRQLLEEELKERQAQAIGELGERAKSEGLALLRTPLGIVFAPLAGEEIVTPEEFQKLEQEERARLEENIEQFQGRLQKVLRQFPRWQRQTQQKLRKLNREVSGFAIGPLVEELQEKYADLAGVLDHLAAVEKDVLDNAPSFLDKEEGPVGGLIKALGGPGDRVDALLRRYQVNVLVDRSEGAGAPVVFEDNPTYGNLVGRVEHNQQMGALVTDFTLIKPGALHRANGGFLLLEAHSLLRQPYAWEGLKRALESGEIKIESLGQALSLVSTSSLEPEPAALSVKVVLLGTPYLYYLLSHFDPDLAKLFKVAADFAERMDSTGDSHREYARLVAKVAVDESLRHFDSGAVARVIEHGARALGDSEKLSLYAGKLTDFLREADYWANKAGRGVVAAEDVQKAIDAQIYRSDRLRERSQEQMLRGTVLVDTAGAVVGQVNALSVLQLGDFSFGRPSRITARVRLGKGEVLDIEREVELSGPIHSKGVLILSGYLGARYAADRPLSLSASLVFEQSYGGIDGDSASAAELYALLSSISGLPIRQSLAVTGSVNQRGDVQAIGGVNEKIEGFFDLCKARGLSGEQGVLIPASNVKHLMLRADVRAAVERGEFHVYPVEQVDRGIEILTGVEAGERDPETGYPGGSVNRLVEDRLAELAAKLKEYSGAGESAAATAGETMAESDGAEVGSDGGEAKP